MGAHCRGGFHPPVPQRDPGADDLLAELRMQPDVCGTWTAERFGNLNGIYYTYLVTVDSQIREVCDPYARTTGVNGCRG